MFAGHDIEVGTFIEKAMLLPTPCGLFVIASKMFAELFSDNGNILLEWLILMSNS